MLQDSFKKYSRYDLFFDSLPQRVSNKSCVVFDLDNTLYNELDFLRQVYSNIANNYYQESPEKAFNFLCQDFYLNGRQGLIDRFLKNFSISEEIDNVLTFFRCERGCMKLNLYPRVACSLQDIKKRSHVAILTNGNREQQFFKITLLGLNNLFDEQNIIYANDFTPKPSPEAMQHILNSSNCSPSHCVFIGDSDVDKKCAELSGVDFIQVPH